MEAVLRKLAPIGPFLALNWGYKSRGRAGSDPVITGKISSLTITGMALAKTGAWVIFAIRADRRLK